MDICVAKDKHKKGIMRLYRQFNDDRIESGVGDSDYQVLDGEMPWAKTLHDEDCMTLILTEKDFVLGFVTLRLSSFNPFKNVDKLAEVDLMVIEKKLRKRGFGTQLFKRASLHLRTYAVTHILINVAVSNKPALNFWKKQRFKTLSSTHFERADGEEEETVYMVRKI